MRSWFVGVTVLALALGACDDDVVFFDGDPDGPRNVDASYFNRGVDLTWDLSPGWNGEPFRVYGKRVSDRDFFLIAEVTSCQAGVCSYRDTNVVAGVSYEYFVAAVDPDSGVETSSEFIIEVFVPEPIPPAIPGSVFAVALDNAAFITWSDTPAEEDDFSAYRVYLAAADGDFLLGETDSPGFVDLLAINGTTFSYFVTSVDDQGHESGGSFEADATPRPDYTGELIYAFQDDAANSGFRFQESEADQAVTSGTDIDRHFRLEVDGQGLWLVPAPGTQIFPTGQFTTALKCGVAADADCTSWELAPTSGYTSQDVPVDAEFTYMFRVAEGGLDRYGAIRVSLVGADQDGDELMVFDWAFQTQPGNPNLSVSGSANVR